MAGTAGHENQPGVIYIPWYATVLRQDAFATAVAEVAPMALRYGAHKYAVHRHNDDRYRIIQMAWFERRGDWYKFWESPEMIAFRTRNMGKYQIPVVYVWHDEVVAGEMGPGVVPEPAHQPEPEPEPSKNYV